MNGSHPESPVFSDNEGEDIQDEDHLGDYSTRFDELMSDEDERSSHDAEDEEPDEAFFYTGVDSEPSGTYREQLRDVLGLEHEEDNTSEQEVERSLIHEVREKEDFEAAMDDEARPADASSDLSATASSPSRSGFLSPPRVVVSAAPDGGPKTLRPFLHPTISRLRSTTPQASRASSVGSFASVDLQLGITTPASHFSALSPTSSQSNLPLVSPTQKDDEVPEEREVFRWSQLRGISDIAHQSHKVSSVLGVPNLGSPTVLTANGLICIGTDAGRILVFDFKQNLKCVCGSADRAIGPVTALALSFDHTYVASGHSSGHIQLFDINNPKAPARFVPPIAPAEIVAGTKEGHLPGSRIISVGFIAGRHTAIVSADDSGLAFYHSLGKVLFVDASDTLRILGKYPDEFSEPAIGLGPAAHPFRRRRLRKAHAILSMAPLPLGTTSHPTDAYNLIALLTPVKLVVVGLKPSPKTWYRRHREVEDDGSSRSRFKGVLAWFPSVASGTPGASNGKGVPSGTMPMLVYGWGNTLNLLRVTELKGTQDLRNPKNGKTSRVEIGRIVFEENRAWTVGSDALALQWLNSNQIVVLTSTTLEVYDVNTSKLVEHVLFDAWSLVSPVLSHTINGSMSYTDAVTEVSHSVRVYKGKIFLLGQHEVRVGTLLTWADRILSLVEDGDFLSAIELARSYYIGEAPGNRNGLPDSPAELRNVVSEKMRGLMVASAEYAFSEDRMTDSTHVTPDGRGVDRTSLFEGLVFTCCRACIALGDFDFLFEDLYSFFDNYGIHRIFLNQIEPFILDGKIHYVPPRITQRLIAMHAEDYRPDLAERIIWHIDPDCLDINQSILLCQQYQLYDALMYVYTRAMRDYVSPVVEMLDLIRQVQRYRRLRIETSPTSRAPLSDAQIESIAINAYKIYPYLGNVLTGVTYPSGDPLPDDDAIQAKNDVYTFLFYGRSSVWPLGEGGRLILTCDEENGVEPTYPYTRLLLRFDAEAFLHILDLAFEDYYLNDDSRGISRLVIVKILLEILATPGIPRMDAMFINIFIARNVPKYPQFIHMEPSTLHGILFSLAEDSDESTREDRQLAAEYLLSAYTPREGDQIIQLFENAGFYRILRSWHRHERHWAPLLDAYMQDQSINAPEMFTSIEEVLVTASRANKGGLPADVLTTVTDSLHLLLETSIPDTAALLDKCIPDLHIAAMSVLVNHPARDRFLYLRSLIGSPRPLDESEHLPPTTRTSPSANIPPMLRMDYIELLCELTPGAVVDELRYLPHEFVDSEDVVRVCEDRGLCDAVIWILNRDGDPQAALEKTQSFAGELSEKLAQTLGSGALEEAESYLVSLGNVQKAAVTVCLERTKAVSSGEVPLEDIWFKLLRSQINCVHRATSAWSPDDDAEDSRAQTVLSTLRSSVHDTFNALLSVSSSKTVSFPGLFKRLVDSKDNHVSKGAQYTEFRAILTGMLDAYRSEGDMLVQTKHLMARDLFVSVEDLARARARGWRPSRGLCSTCGELLHDVKGKGKGKAVVGAEDEGRRPAPVIVSRTGAIYHRHCFPADHTSSTS